MLKKNTNTIKINLTLLLTLIICNITAQVTFQEKIISNLDTNISKPHSIFSVDFDNDGDMDIVSGLNNSIVWFENIDGQPWFSEPKIIQNEGSIVKSVYVVDVDGDNFLDIISTVNQNGKIVWYKNLDGQGNFGTQQIIATNVNGKISVSATDIDGDNDIDILVANVVANESSLVWYQNLNGQGNFSTENVIATSSIGSKVSFADFDNDGDMDVVVADPALFLYENTDGQGNFILKQVIDNTHRIIDFSIADFDNDGDLDITSSGNSGKIIWYKNFDGLGSFVTEQVIDDFGNISIKATTVFSADFDNDGDIDIVSSIDNFLNDQIIWYENTNGNGLFNIEHTIGIDDNRFGKINSIFAIDLDGDNDQDIIIAKDEKIDHIAWFENTNNGNFGNKNFIGSERFGTPIITSSADIDDDGDMDLVIIDEFGSSVVWFKNVDGLGKYNIGGIIPTTISDPHIVSIADMDVDGDLDIVISFKDSENPSFNSDTVWFENMNGQGDFIEKHNIITNSVFTPIDIQSIDINNDTYNDLILAFSNRIVWRENNGNGQFFSEQLISSNVGIASSVYYADIDSDGDIDVLSASEGDNKIAWYENLNGLGNFGTQNIIATNAIEAQSIFAIDIDGDNDIDVLSASQGDNKIAWYENLDGLGNFSSHNIITINANLASKVFAADIDGDNDIDVFSASRGDDKVAWYENLDGTGNYGVQNIISNNSESLFVTDIDNNGYNDVFTASRTDNSINWYKNLTVDNQAPVAICKDIILALDINGSAILNPTDIDDNSSDNIGITNYSINISNFSCSNLGNQDVILTVFDANGNSDNCTATVTIIDNLAPIVDNIDLTDIINECEITILTEPTATDNCAGTIIGTHNITLPITTQGTTVVTWTYDDGNGNTTTQLQNIIINDVTNPTASNLTSIIVECFDEMPSPDIQVITNINDNCTANPTVIFVSDVSDGNTNPEIITRTYSVTDNNGNTLFVEQLIEINDVTNPTASNLTSINVQCNDEIPVPDILLITDASDNCTNTPIITFTSDVSNNNICPEIITRTYSISDDSNNVFFINQLITIIDTENPIANCNDITINLDASNNANITVNDINNNSTDNCGIAIISVTPNAFTSENLGDNNVILTVTDLCGNTNTCNAIVTVNSTISIEDYNILKFDLYPNPTTGKINIESDTSIFKISFYSKLGQLILENKNQTEIDISNLSQGIYFVKVEDIDGNFGVKKVIKK